MNSKRILTNFNKTAEDVVNMTTKMNKSVIFKAL